MKKCTKERTLSRPQRLVNRLFPTDVVYQPLISIDQCENVCMEIFLAHTGQSVSVLASNLIGRKIDTYTNQDNKMYRGGIKQHTPEQHITQNAAVVQEAKT